MNRFGKDDDILHLHILLLIEYIRKGWWYITPPNIIFEYICKGEWYITPANIITNWINVIFEKDDDKRSIITD